MKTLVGHGLSYLVSIGCATALASAWAQEPGTRLTPELLQSRIAAAQDSSELDEASKARLVELYRQSVSNLEARGANQEAAEEYRQARRDAPAQTEKIRATLERRGATDPTADLHISSSTTSDQLTRKLDEQLANLLAVESKLAILEARLESEAQRPSQARERIAAARALMGDLAAQSRDRAAPSETAQIAEAARWVAETRLEALRTEIASLDQELLSYEARKELLKAQRDEAAQSVSRIGQRVDVLRAAVNERRRLEAELVMAQARAALDGAASGEPLVHELAEANLALVKLLREQVERLDELAARERSLPGTSELETAYRGARRKLELEGWRTPVGQAILAQRRQFPSAREYTAERRALSRWITGVSLRLIEADEERRALSDVGAYLDSRIAEAAREALEPGARTELENLSTTRRSLLDRAIANDNALQQRLYALDDALRRLTDRTTAYDELLAERLLWVRSTPAIDREALARLPAEVADYLTPGRWLDTVREAAVGLVRAPLFLLMGVAALALAWRRGRIRGSLVGCGQNIGRVQQDSMKSTFRALAFTLMLAAPVPLLLVALGGSLSTADEAVAFPNGVGSALLKTAAWLAFPVVLRALFEPGGVAHRHFGWDVEPLAALRRQLAWFIGLVFPVYFVLLSSIAVETRSVTSGRTLTLLCFVAVVAGLVALVIGIGHPEKGVVGHVLASRSGSAGWRWRYLWFPLAVLLSVALGALALFGFTYTAEDLMRRLFQSIWSLAAIWLGAVLVRRWLLMTGRRLAYQEAVAAGDADRARQDEEGGEAGEGPRVDDDIGSPEVDLVALDADSHKLLNASVLLTVALVLVGIWGEVIPALGILENVELWGKKALVDGIERSVPVTLADLLVAAVIGAGGYILARNLPSLLDIVLLKQGSLTAGGRYTVETLTRYIITAVAALAVLQVLGASGAQLGWAAAALGVGIGFGLQEIVANFICGLILLFERPVRVGDVVTIGDASGVVSRIRIRATTIRDWEQKELVVPNKELITGRLLNWTLSDAVTRVFITVGVAYGSDVERAMALIREAAQENSRVLDDPEPVVHFEQFADSSLNLTLRAYTGALSDRLPAITELHRAIDQKFRAAGIVIAFPQRDVHFHSGVGDAALPSAGSGGCGDR